MSSELTEDEVLSSGDDVSGFEKVEPNILG